MFFPTLYVAILLVFFLNVESKEITSLCDKPINTSGKRKNYSSCVCETENSVWGELVLIIDCSDKFLSNDGFSAQKLPEFTESLDVAYNQFDKLPNFEGFELKYLDGSYNRIDSLELGNFANIPNVREIDLNNNAIKSIQFGAFSGLENLTALNLADNKISMLPQKVFEPLIKLSSLILSGNDQIRATFHKVGFDLYLYLGVTPNLKKLEIEKCYLSTIDIKRGSWLSELCMAQNDFKSLPELPGNIDILDISMNPIERLSADFLTGMSNLKMLLMQDMPYLTTVEAKSLSAAFQLQHVSFRGSHNLTKIDPYAFNVDEGRERALEVLNLQGTRIVSFNESWIDVLRNIKALDLSGNPINCDCNLRWIRKLHIETNGQCIAPRHLKGVLLSGVPENKYECRLFPKWVYTLINGLIIIAVIIICSLAVWFVAIRLKRTTERHHTNNNVHSSSPYAPITIANTTVKKADEAYY